MFDLDPDVTQSSNQPAVNFCPRAVSILVETVWAVYFSRCWKFSASDSFMLFMFAPLVGASISSVGISENNAVWLFLCFSEIIRVFHHIKISELEIVTDFKYLGSLTESTESDIRARKASAWRACNKLKKIWKSALSRSFKIRLFQAVVESVLVYGSEAWTLTASLERQLNGCYTRLLRCALNIDWRDHVTNEVLYGDLPPPPSAGY